MKTWLNIFLVILLNSCGNKILEKNYELDYDPNHEICLIIPDDGYQLIKIPGHILFYGHNNDFIIASQKPSDSIYNPSKNLPSNERMNLIFKTKFSNFWIINLANDSVFGHLNKTEYLKMREKLHVPKNLKLDHSTREYYFKGDRNDIDYYELDSAVVDIKTLTKNNQ